MSRASKAVNEFLTEAFTPKDEFKDDVKIPNPSKWNCTFCPYKNKKELCNVGVS
jgi:hypothetical protein